MSYSRIPNLKCISENINNSFHLLRALYYLNSAKSQKSIDNISKEKLYSEGLELLCIGIADLKDAIIVEEHLEAEKN